MLFQDFLWRCVGLRHSSEVVLRWITSGVISATVPSESLHCRVHPIVCQATGRPSERATESICRYLPYPSLCYIQCSLLRVLALLAQGYDTSQSLLQKVSSEPRVLRRSVSLWCVSDIQGMFIRRTYINTLRYDDNFTYLRYLPLLAGDYSRCFLERSRGWRLDVNGVSYYLDVCSTCCLTVLLRNPELVSCLAISAAFTFSFDASCVPEKRSWYLATIDWTVEPFPIDWICFGESVMLLECADMAFREDMDGTRGLDSWYLAAWRQTHLLSFSRSTNCLQWQSLPFRLPRQKCDIGRELRYTRSRDVAMKCDG